MTAQLQTYAWDGHLDNFMPWRTPCKQDCNTRPSLISHAMWNAWQEPTMSMLQNCFASSHRCPHQPLNSLHNPLNKLQMGTLDKPSDSVPSACNPIPSSPSYTTQLIGPMSTSFILAAIWMYL